MNPGILVFNAAEIDSASSVAAKLATGKVSNKASKDVFEHRVGVSVPATSTDFLFRQANHDLNDRRKFQSHTLVCYCKTKSRKENLSVQAQFIFDDYFFQSKKTVSTFIHNAGVIF
jgi:hypothetical protein